MNKENFWYVFKDKDPVGVAFIHSIDMSDKHGRYAVGIYNSCNWEHGYGQEITRAVLQYAFNKLDLHKIDLRVLAYNTRAISSYKKSGFVIDGVLRDNAFINQQWHDDIIMSILKSEFVY